MIYGKTVISTVRDIHDDYSSFLTPKECYQVAYLCFKFWSLTGHGKPDQVDPPYQLGWFSSALDRPVFYGIPYFTTVLDYMSTMGVNI